MRLQHPRRRAGFTLVELLVAAGLTLLIMAILSTAFQVGLDSLRLLKATGHLADRLRTAETLLRQDLDAPHFDTGVSSALSPQTNNSGSNPGGLLLSQLRLDLDPTVRPAGGFFQIRQPVHPVGFVTFEGADQDQLSSTHALTHGISFTARRTGKTPGDLFAAVDPSAQMGTLLAQPANQTDVAIAPNAYMAEWAEVHWFLDLNRPTPVNGVNTFPLCRRVRLLTRGQIGGVMPGTSLAEVVSADPAGTTNTLASIAATGNRLGGGATPLSLFTSANGRQGDDIVITNVVSFEVKPTGVCPTLPTWPRPSLGAAFNADFPFDDLPTNEILFDTALGGFAPAAGTPVLPARVTGVQIKIRIYDGKSKITRQAVVTSKL